MPEFNFRPHDDIAVIGMAARVPGADDCAGFWDALTAGESFVTGLSNDRLAADLAHAADPHVYDRIRPLLHNAGLTQIDAFDPAFFHITPREARVMDPQQRLILEESWHCIEDAGIGLTELQEHRTSVFVGATGNDYALLAFQQGAGSDPYAPLGNFSCMLANRISHAYGFSAESMSVDTACSSSLVALDLAVKELRSGTSDYSMVGGVCLTNHPWRFVSFSRAHMMSPDGVCRAFDGAADGFVQGEGVGVLLLERLEDALERHHRILGVVRGSAVNHGGAVKNVTAPNPAAQQAVIETALRRAEIAPSAVSYVEAHGTGTSLGDPIEVESLTRAFRRIDPDLGCQQCGIGSVKTNIGHLGSAAGVIGVIKVLLMMQHRELVSSLNLENENPLIGFADTPFYPVQQHSPWLPAGGQELLIAGVSAFGFGGVNAHVVLASCPLTAPTNPAVVPQVPFLLSAHTEQSLAELVRSWRRFTDHLRPGTPSHGSVARTLVVGRQHLGHRRGVLLEPGTELGEALGELAAAEHPVSGAIHLQMGSADLDPNTLPAGPVARELARLIAEPEPEIPTAGTSGFVLGTILLRTVPGIASVRTDRNQGLVALALVGAISVADLGRALGDPNSWEQIRVTAPRLPLCGLNGERWLTPVTVDDSYLAELVAICRSEAVSETLPLTQIHQLFEHQVTYRRLMLDWMGAADEHLGADAARIRQETAESALIEWFASDPARGLLLHLMHESTVSGIRRKWQLRERAGSQAIAELAALVVGEHLTPGQALGLLATDDPARVAAAVADLDGLMELPLDPAEMPLLAARQPGLVSLATVMAHAPADQDAAPAFSLVDDHNRIHATIAGLEDITPGLLDLWLAGMEVAWNQYLDLDEQPAALPGTCYDRECYWLDLPALPTSAPPIGSRRAMLGSATISDRTPSATIVATTISGEQFFVRDHVVGGIPILPGVAYVELALEAASLVTGERPQGVRDVVWLRPMRFDQDVISKRVEIHLVPEGAQVHRFTVISWGTDGAAIEHARGVVSTEADQVSRHTGRRLDLSTTAQRAQFSFNREQVYGEVFGEAIGFNYGPSFQLTEAAHGLGESTLEVLDSAKVLASTGQDFIAHPSILDASLRAVNWLGNRADCISLVMQVPFSMAELVLIGDLDEARYAVATLSANCLDHTRVRAHDLDICAADGTVLAHVSGFTLRPLHLDQSSDRPQIYARGLTPVQVPVVDENPVDQVVVIAGEGVEPQLRDLAVSLGSARAAGCVPTVIGRGADLAEMPGLGPDLRIEVIECAADQGPGHDLSLNDLGCLVSVAELFQLATARGWSVNHSLLCTEASVERSLFESLEVITRSVRFINPEYTVGVLELATPSARWNPFQPDELALIAQAHRSLARASLLLVGPDGIQGYRFAPHPLEADPSVAPCVVSGKRYLVTGGSGRLAIELVRHYRDRCDAEFILAGRRPLTELPAERRTAIEDLGAAVSYHSCDATDAAQVEALVAELCADVPIAGVFHLAGSIGSHSLTTVDRADIERIVGPKVIGAAHIDRATAALPLDFFVLFSSLSALVGDSDGSGYAVANAALNAFGEQRRQMVAEGTRQGVTCSVMWPVWQEGALRPTGKQDIVLTKYFGLTELGTHEAFEALDLIVAQEVSQCVVLKGDPRRYGRILGHVNGVLTSDVETVPRPESIADAGDRQLFEWLAGLVAAESGIGSEVIGGHVPLAEYGIDSIMIISLLERMGERFTELPSTLFFQCQTLNEVIDYLRVRYPQTVVSSDQIDSRVAPDAPATLVPPRAGESVETAHSCEEVAIIGYSGRYPMSENLDEFWAHLLAGDDCIEVVPRDRWDHDQYFAVEPGLPGKVNTKWGGFLRDPAGFDAAFFGVSQGEAKLMDPQERLFLETVEHALEHAGYPREKIRGSQTAVYVGVMNGHYQLLGAEELSVGHVIDARSTYASIANRVSYVFDLHGASVAVDTMCSSSLTAIHLACADLRSGRSPMAVAGGVNVILHPLKYVFLSEQHFGSTEGKCRAFGDGGDGYVPAEGVGAVILKPLAQAVADGDVIHAVIRATTLNHGGRTHGFTVPNPRAQAELITAALGQAQVSASEIGYVEAHGTGTVLGDPVEVASLVDALDRCGLDLPDRQVPIGSVKANIGHTEASAGVASLTKVLLQMKYATLVPSIHADPINPRLELDRRPLRVVSAPEPWDLTAHPTALISSFGAGGSNAHLIVSCYQSILVDQDSEQDDCEPGRSHLVVLSAISDTALTDQVVSLADWLGVRDESTRTGATRQTLEANQMVCRVISELTGIDLTQITPEQTLFDLGLDSAEFIRLRAGLEQALEKPCRILGTDTIQVREIVEQVAELVGSATAPEGAAEPGENDLLARIARTTQLCRDGYEWRVAFAVRSLDELTGALRAHLAGEPHPATWTGSSDRYRNVTLIDDAVLRDAARRDDWDEIAFAWVTGSEANWTILHSGQRRFVDLPGYAFHRTHLWLDRQTSTGIRAPARSRGQVSARVSFDAGSCVRFTHTFRAADPMITGHIVCGCPIVPGAGQLAAVRDCLGLLDTDLDLLSEVRFMFPIEVRRDLPVSISFISEDHQARVRIESVDDSGRNVLHSTLVVRPTQDQPAFEEWAPPEDPERQRHVGHDELYQAFESEGIVYGSSLRRLVQVEQGTDTVTARLCPTDPSIESPLVFVSTLDAALQMPAVFVGPVAGGEQVTHVPAAIDHLRILREAPAASARLRRTGLASFNVELLDAQDQPVMQLTGLRVANLPTVPVNNPSVPRPESVDRTDSAEHEQAQQVLERLAGIVAEILKTPVNQINPTWTFTDLGVDSISGFRIVEEINACYGTDIKPTALFDYSTIEQLRDHLLKSPIPIGRTNPVDTRQPCPVTPVVEGRQPTGFQRIPEPIAIIGMAGQFPGAGNIDEFWELLQSGRSAISEVPPERWDADLLHTDDPSDLSRTTSRWGGFVDGVDRFDPEFFAITGFEARWMDPQQRLMLTEAWRALDDAGYAGHNPYRERTGVFVGCCPGDYQDLILTSGVELEPQSFWGTSPAAVSARIAYTLNLGGPCSSFDTACSSALSACYFACHSLWAEQCEMAVVGGVFLLLSPKFYLMAGHSGMLSPGGRCATFSADADGFVPGEAVGALVLKPLSKALADQDQVIAVIKGIDMDQDGRTNGLTAPNAAAQTRVVRTVHERFGIDPASITYIETHGTGTPVGDAIEVAALSEVFTGHRDGCALGSVKTNIGHSSAAAGAVGLIKVALSLGNRTLPPSLHFESENPQIRFVDTPFQVVDELRGWQAASPRRAGLSSLGFGGTNVHAVLEEAPADQRVGPSSVPPDGAPYLFPIAARSTALLPGTVATLLAFLKQRPKCSPLDLSYTLNRRHSRMNPVRLMVRASTVAELTQALQEAIDKPEQMTVGQPLTSPVVDIRFSQARMIHLPAALLGEHSYWFQTDHRVPVGFAGTPTQSSEADELVAALTELRDGVRELDEVSVLLEGISDGR